MKENAKGSIAQELNHWFCRFGKVKIKMSRLFIIRMSIVSIINN
jgi:hypothetical protein